MAIILGIDPGSRICGYGIIDSGAGDPRYLASGVIRLSATAMVDRLSALFDGLESIAEQYKPQQAAIEKVFVGKSADSALKLGQARGVALLAMVRNSIPLAEYSPRSIKQTVTGSGAADKIQVADMVVRCLKLTSSPSEDASDALAIALCHAYSIKYQRAVEASARETV